MNPTITMPPAFYLLSLSIYRSNPCWDIIKESELSSFTVTFLAVDWLPLCRFERNFAFLPAFRASCLMHLSWPELSRSKVSFEAASVKICHLFFPPIRHKEKVLRFLLCIRLNKNYPFKNFTF